MIFPFPENPFQKNKTTIMWTMLGLNVFLFFLIFAKSEFQVSNALNILTDQDLEVSGELYLQYYDNLDYQHQMKKPNWIRQVQLGHAKQLQMLGAYSLRDKDFLVFAKENQFSGDQIAIEHWQKDLKVFEKKYAEQSVFRFGLNSMKSSPLSWITYQFSHANFMHLISNMFFLIFIGSAVEAAVGSLAFILIYLCGGVAGGLLFLLIDSHGTAPIVGASASISALLAFYCLFEDRRRIRYFYFVSPFPRQYGHIYLPTLLIIPMFIISDITSLVASPEGLAGGVAFSAHIGGSLFGILLALVMRYGFHMKRPLPEVAHVIVPIEENTTIDNDDFDF